MDTYSSCLKCKKQFERTEQVIDNQLICARCLYQALIKDHLRKIELEEYIFVNCDQQGMHISLPQIRDILNQLKNEIQADFSQNVCPSHYVEKDVYCVDCQLEACSFCAVKGSQHFGHNYVTSKILMDQLKQLPSINSLNLNPVELRFDEEFNEHFLPTLQYYDNVIQTLEKTRSNFINEMKVIYMRINILIQITRLLYIQFYSDIKKMSSNITQLIFLNQVKLLGPSITLNSHTIEKIDTRQIQAQFTFNEVHFQKFISTISLAEHSDSINALVQLKDGRIASGSRDKNIKIWEASQNIFTCVQTLNGHTDGVFALLQLKDRRLVSGSSDKTIRLWENNQNIFICSHIVIDHTGTVYSLLQLNDGRLLSGSSDNSIKIWEKKQNTFTCTQTLTEHAKAVHVVIQLTNGKLASGSDDMTIKIISNINQEYVSSIHTLTGHTNSVISLLQLQDGRLASGSVDNTIRIWEIMNTPTCSDILTGHTYSVKALVQLKDGRLVSGSVDNTLRIWEIRVESFVCSQILNGHSNSIHSLMQLQDGRIASGSEDNTIRIWEKVEEKVIQGDKQQQSCCIY